LGDAIDRYFQVARTNHGEAIKKFLDAAFKVHNKVPSISIRAREDGNFFSSFLRVSLSAPTPSEPLMSTNSTYFQTPWQ
jgi:hypothetical protein